ncbi:sugar phosphate isomerase/epimerase family protein [Ochrobactrum quorumnocens]|uniref:sugar phosphate isomerase/epimerase family protein n=1 Tax=Ochrobactrum quorumnocens TaxID=271865 RepID=UPI0038535A2B
MMKAYDNQIGVHALVWTGDTSKASIELAARRSVEAGYDLLELSLHDLDNLDVEHARSVLSASGLAIVCSRGLAFDADVSSDDTSVVRKGAELLHQSLIATHGLGGKLLTGALYSALGKYGKPASTKGRENAVAVIKDLASDASKLGITLGLEVCNRYETHLINTARQALSLADDIGADNTVIHLDTYHMNIEEDNLIRPLHEVGERLGYIHIGENHRGYLGSGHIDFTGFFHALMDIGYKGPITFESFSSAVIAEGLSNDLAIWRDTWSDGFELAQHARSFVDIHLAVG